MRLHGAALAALALLSIACGADGPADGATATGGASVARRPSLIVITLDTTRADHLSCYGYPVQTTPRLDARAATALRFSRAYAPMAQTLPSHASLFTGLSPRQHGLTENHRHLAPEQQTLAERLAAAGYQTAGFVGSVVLDVESGIAQGFQHFDESPAAGAGVRRIERDAKAVTDAALTWVARRDDERPLFLWVHYFDPHMPYQGPDALMAQLDVEPIVALLAERGARQAAADPSPEAVRLDTDSMALYWRAYDTEIRYTDHHLGRLLDGLERVGLLSGALLLVAGDHGEGLFEHGERGHGVNLFEELVHVPLLLWTPGGEMAGRVVDQPLPLAAVHDLLQRLCLGAESGSAGAAGARLWESLQRGGRSHPEPVFLERPHYSPEHLVQRSGRDDPLRYQPGEMTAVVAGTLKFVVGPAGEEALYDLVADPDELENLVQRRPQDAARLRSLLEAWRCAQPVASDRPGDEQALSEERRQALEQLGYGH